jgi:hypothetical protein
MIFLPADIAPGERRRIIIMAQLYLKDHTGLRSEKIFASHKVKFPHADKFFVVMILHIRNIFEKCMAPFL